MSRRLGLLTLLVCTVLLVTACSVDYSGQYGGLSDAGIFVSMTLGKDGTVETNMLGIPVTGTYTVKNDQITVKLTTMGYSQSIKGRITKDTIEFSDATLKRGVTSVDISDVSSLLGGASQTKATATPTAKATTKPTKAPQNESEIKFNEAEKLFAIGHYDEAIAIYDEIVSEMDVEDRRAYAIECRDIRDLHFTWKYKNDQLVLTEYVGYGLDKVIIPYGVCALEDDTFEKSNPAIMEVQLPDTLTQIPYGCFSGCSNLTKINIPSSINSIALNGTGITELVIPETVTTVPRGAFAHCTKLKTVVFEGGITFGRGLATGVFEGCTSLENVTLHQSFQEISYAMFRNCSALKTIVLPSGITKIDEFAFYGCSSLEAITLNDNITSIGRSSFENCISLQAISWPKQCPIISEYVMRNCTSLSNVIIPESITSIEARAFEGCTHLNYISLPSKTKSIHFMAFGDSEDRTPVTLYLTKGTYAHRYAEENCISYLFEEYESDEYPSLWSTTTLGVFEGEPIEWMILAYCGDQYLMLSKYPMTYMQLYPTRTDITWEQTLVYDWITNTFSNRAFSAEEKTLISSVGLLPRGYYYHYIYERANCSSYFSDRSGKRENVGWLMIEGTNDCANCAGSYSIPFMETVNSTCAVRPAIRIKLNTPKAE